MTFGYDTAVVVLRPLFLASAAVAVACSCGASPSGRAHPKESDAAPLPAQPADLAFTVSLPSVDHGLDGLLAFVDATSPADGVALRSWAIAELAKLEGVDRSKPVRIVGLATARENRDWGVLVAATDPAKLEDDFGAIRQQGTWAFIASPASIEKLAPWALQTLALQSVPDAPALTLYPGPILAAHPEMISRGRAKWLERARADMEPVIGGMFDDLVAGIRQVERIDARLDAAAARISVEVGAVAKPGTSLAAYIATQKPATYALLPRTTTDGAMALAAGRSLPDLTARFYTRMLERIAKTMPKSPFLPSPEVMRRVETITQGEIVMSLAGSDGGRLPVLSFLAESPTPDGVQAIYEDGLRTIPGMFDVTHHDGVRVIHVRGAELRFAHWDDVTGFAVGATSRTRMERLIDVSRGRIAGDALPKGIAAAFDESRRRKESFLVVIDPVAFVTQTPGEDGLSLGLGFTNGAVRLRAAIDARQLSAVLGVMRARDAF